MSGLIFVFVIGGVGTAVSSRQWSTTHKNDDVAIAHQIGAASVSGAIIMCVPSVSVLT